MLDKRIARDAIARSANFVGMATGGGTDQQWSGHGQGQASSSSAYPSWTPPPPTPEAFSDLLSLSSSANI
eukprot:3841948-Prorocentrum_lima.AAC.1